MDRQIKSLKSEKSVNKGKFLSPLSLKLGNQRYYHLKALGFTLVNQTHWVFFYCRHLKTVILTHTFPRIQKTFTGLHFHKISKPLVIVHGVIYKQLSLYVVALMPRSRKAHYWHLFLLFRVLVLTNAVEESVDIYSSRAISGNKRVSAVSRSSSEWIFPCPTENVICSRFSRYPNSLHTCAQITRRFL